jgi:hypothetical protein
MIEVLKPESEQALYLEEMVLDAIRKGMINPSRIMELFEQKLPYFGPRSPKWSKVRTEWLKIHPMCMICDGREFLQVHHKKPFHLHPELELNPGNLITLCERPSRNCHFVWGHLYNWSHYNAMIDDCVNYWRGIRNQYEKT